MFFWLVFGSIPGSVVFLLQSARDDQMTLEIANRDSGAEVNCKGT